MSDLARRTKRGERDGVVATKKSLAPQTATSLIPLSPQKSTVFSLASLAPLTAPSLIPLSPQKSTFFSLASLAPLTAPSLIPLSPQKSTFFSLASLALTLRCPIPRSRSWTDSAKSLGTFMSRLPKSPWLVMTFSRPMRCPSSALTRSLVA
jgi:hypothetical protein